MRAPSPRSFGRAGARGFTIAEMLAVIAMIGILTVVASPVFIDMMRDRRINRAATNIADYYRTARTRALGRGRPVLIHWDASAGLQKGSSGVLTITEPVVGTSPSVDNLTMNCMSVNWAAPGATYTYTSFDVGDGHYENAVISFKDDKGNPLTSADICYSPRGGAYLRTASGFAQLTGVTTFTAANVKGPGINGLTRTVFIPPNGVARLAQ